MDPQSSDKHPYKRHTDERHTEKRKGRVTREAETGAMWPQAKKCGQLPEARISKDVASLEAQQEHSPLITVTSDLWPAEP